MKEIAAELGFGVHLGDYGGPLVCINRVGLAHRAPGDDRLEPGDLLILDHALEHEGYHSDLARTIYVPRDGETEPPEAERAAFASAKQAIEAAFAALKPGVPGHEVDAAARATHLANGYPRSATPPATRSDATSTTAARSSARPGSATATRRTARCDPATSSRSSRRS